MAIPCIAILFWSTLGVAPAFEPSGPLEANEGHVLLSWSDETEGTYVVKHDPAGGASAATLDAGPDQQMFMTGLAAGTHRFQVGRVDKNTPEGSEPTWSEPLEVTVTYPETSTVIPMLGLGLVVGILTAGFIILGHRRSGTAGNA